MKMDLENQFRSESLYRSLIEQLPVGIFRKDAEGHYILVNAYFCNVRKKNPGDILGKNPKELATKNDSENEVRLLLEGAIHHEEIMRTGKPIEVEEEYSRPDGSKTWMRVLKSPAFDSNGVIVGSQGLMVEITQRKQTEAQLNHEQSLLRALMDHSPDLIYFKDAQSKFIRCSKALVQRMGLKDEKEILGKTDFDFYEERIARGLFQDEQKIIISGEPLVGKIEKDVLKDSREFWVLTNKAPLWDKQGQPIGIFGISKDITAIKEAEARLNEVHGQLVDASRQAGMAEVATSVLHNVGNVLNSVNVSSSLIADHLRKSKVSSLGKVIALMEEHKADLGNFFVNDPKGKQVPDYLANLAAHLVQEQEEVLREVASLAENVHHIKEIVSMQQNYARTFGVQELLPVADLLEDALRLNSGAMMRHNIKLVREYAEVPPVLTEKHKVLQILVNLIRNAKHACDDSKNEDKQITLRITNGDDRVRIQIIDNGVGIATENLTRIFNHGFTTRREGHGFGLHSGAIAAKEIGGSLTAFSEGHGRGATFTLELPANGKNSFV
jgi:PAS domain S-box-containing protein